MANWWEEGSTAVAVPKTQENFWEKDSTLIAAAARPVETAMPEIMGPRYERRPSGTQIIEDTAFPAIDPEILKVAQGLKAGTVTPPAEPTQTVRTAIPSGQPAKAPWLMKAIAGGEDEAQALMKSNLFRKRPDIAAKYQGDSAMKYFMDNPDQSFIPSIFNLKLGTDRIEEVNQLSAMTREQRKEHFTKKGKVDTSQFFGKEKDLREYMLFSGVLKDLKSREFKESLERLQKNVYPQGAIYGGGPSPDKIKDQLVVRDKLLKLEEMQDRGVGLPAEILDSIANMGKYAGEIYLMGGLIGGPAPATQLGKVGLAAKMGVTNVGELLNLVTERMTPKGYLGDKGEFVQTEKGQSIVMALPKSLLEQTATYWTEQQGEAIGKGINSVWAKKIMPKLPKGIASLITKSGKLTAPFYDAVRKGKLDGMLPEMVEEYIDRVIKPVLKLDDQYRDKDDTYLTNVAKSLVPDPRELLIQTATFSLLPVAGHVTGLVAGKREGKPPVMPAVSALKPPQVAPEGVTPPPPAIETGKAPTAETGAVEPAAGKPLTRMSPKERNTFKLGMRAAFKMKDGRIIETGYVHTMPEGMKTEDIAEVGFTRPDTKEFLTREQAGELTGIDEGVELEQFSEEISEAPPEELPDRELAEELLSAREDRRPKEVVPIQQAPPAPAEGKGQPVPQVAGKKVIQAYVKDEQGNIYTANTHGEAYMKMEDAGGTEKAIRDSGFVVDGKLIPDSEINRGELEKQGYISQPPAPAPAAGQPVPQVAGEHVVYHGGPASIETLSVSASDLTDVRGVYFSDNADTAQSYAEMHGKGEGIVRQYKITLKNPANSQIVNQVKGELEEEGHREPQLWDLVTEELKDRGYDGVIQETGEGTEYIVFDDAAIQQAPPAPAEGQGQKQAWEISGVEVTSAEAEKTFPIEGSVEIVNGKPVYKYSTTIKYGDADRTFEVTSRGSLNGVQSALRLHKKVVQQALAEGKPVPRNVLEEYKSEPWAQEALQKAEAAPAEGQAQKQAWEMTLEEYRQSLPIPPRSNKVGGTKELDKSYAIHKASIKNAIERGEVIPDRVLSPRYNNTEFKVRQAEVQAAKKLYGDRDDVVKNQYGMPLEVYRGGPKSVAELIPNKIGVIFLTSNEKVASYFASVHHKTSSVVSTYVAMKNPLIVDAGKIEAGSNPERIEGWIEQAKKNANDGVIIRNIKESGFLVDDYIVFNREQILRKPQAPPAPAEGKKAEAAPPTGEEKAEVTEQEAPEPVRIMAQRQANKTNKRVGIYLGKDKKWHTFTTLNPPKGVKEYEAVTPETPEMEQQKQEALKVARKNVREHLTDTEKKAPAAPEAETKRGPITAAEKDALRAKGYSVQDILKMTPAEARGKLEGPEKPKGGGAGGSSVAAASAEATGSGYGTIAASEKSAFSEKTDHKRLNAEMPARPSLQIIDNTLKIAAPAIRGEQARATARVVRKNLGQLAQETSVLHETLKKAHRAFTFMKRDDVYSFIDRMENGQAQSTPKLEEISRKLRELLDDRRDRVQGLGKGLLEHFYENYFPHIWKNPKGAEAVIRQFFTKRRLQGPKSFLKKRTIMTVKEGRELGLELVSENPVDLVLLKLHEMDRFLMAHRIIQDMKSRSLIKFVYSRLKAPDGYIKIDDRAFTVYMPPEITKKEAYDALLVDQLMDVARSMGIDTQRFVSIGGKRWGFAQWPHGAPGSGPFKVRTKYAGPESVLAHEIGHILGAKYNLYDTLRRVKEGGFRTVSRGEKAGEQKFVPAQEAVEHRKTIDKEWRALADARYKGQDVGPGFKGYVRKAEEKEAVMLEALIHAPDEFKAIAPTLHNLFTKFLNSHSELRPILDMKPSLVLGQSDAQIKIPGFTVLGHYYAPEPAARLLNNYLSPGLRNNENLLLSGGYNMLRKGGNILNQAQLSLSLWHALDTTIDTMNSTMAMGIRRLMTPEQRLAGLGNILSAPLAPILRTWDGIRLRRAYRNQIDTIEDPRLRSLVEAVVLANGRDKLDPFYYNHATKNLTNTLSQIIRGSGLEKLSGILRLPADAVTSTLEVLAKPLMEWYVPSGKMGVFSVMAEHEMKRAMTGQISDEQLHERLVRSWDSVDNRMGELVYDNLFWNKTLKDILMLSMRSVGWNLGSFREYGGAPIDILMTKQRLNRGDLWLSLKMSYTISSVLLYGMIGATIMYLLTGKGPDDDRDYFFPKTGRKNPDGSDERLSLPTYAKDWYGFGLQPIQQTRNKAHPFWSVLNDLVQNKDFFNVQIRDPKDPLSKQILAVAKHLGAEFLPLSAKNYQKMQKAEPGQQGKNLWVSLTGITSAPSYITRSPAQKLMYRYIVEKIPDKTVSTEQYELRMYRNNLKTLLRKGAPVDPIEAKKRLGLTEWNRLKTEAKKDPFAESFSRLGLEEALNVFAIASPEEKAKVGTILRTKYTNAESKTKTPEIKELYNQLQGQQQSSSQGGLTSAEILRLIQEQQQK